MSHENKLHLFKKKLSIAELYNSYNFSQEMPICSIWQSQLNFGRAIRMELYSKLFCVI